MLMQHLPLLSKKYIVLASSSPRRAELLTGLGIKADVVPSTFPENLVKSDFQCPGDYAKETATQKALEVYRRIENIRPIDLVIGADTVVEIDGLLLEKPRDKTEAFQMLSNLSGRQHVVFTGVALVLPIHGGKNGQAPFVQSFWEQTKVDFCELEREAIDAYVASGEPLDKAGAYGIQGIGGSFVKGIHGCFFNVMGFPVHRICEEVDKLIKAKLLEL